MLFKLDVDKFYLALDKAIEAEKTVEENWQWHKEVIERSECKHVVLSQEEVKPLLSFM